MLGACVFFFGLASVLGSPSPEAECTPSEFQAWFADASEGKLRIPPEVERGARQFRYVFVEGFYNERMPGYFAQNAKELRSRGVPRGAIHFIAPSSHETIEGNFDEVRDRFREIAKQGPEKLVVIAHSRGACDTLVFALRNSEFVRDHVQALFLVQGPFGGTGIADYVLGEGSPLDHRIPVKYRVVAHVLGKLEQQTLRNGKHGGLSDLTRSASRAFWKRTLDEHADAIPIVGPKTFYVTTETSASRLRLFKRATAWYLDTHFGANDGVVALEDQSLPQLGTVLAVLDAGHSDLTNKFPSGRAGRRNRGSLMRSILMTVGRSAPDAHAGEKDRAEDEGRERPGL